MSASTSVSSAGTPSDGTATIRSPASAESFPARRQHRHLRAALGDRVDLAGDRVEEVLAVVEHQQQPLRRQVLEHRLLEAAARAAAGTRKLAASVSHTAAGSVTGANSHNHAPSGNSATTSAATCRARRVLPTPPTPVSVTSDDRAHQVGQRRDLRLATDERRHLARQVARQHVQRPQRRELRRPDPAHPPGTRAPTTADRAVGAHPGRRGRRLGSCPATSAAVAPEITTWPPCATAISRAHRFRVWLSYWSPMTRPSPVCTPIRARSGPVSPHGSTVRPRSASTAARDRSRSCGERSGHPVAPVLRTPRPRADRSRPRRMT